MDLEKNKDRPFLHGFKACTLIALAGFIFGAAFGSLAHVKGLTFIHSAVMSAFIYAGAAQMVALTMWNANDLPTFALVITSFVICLRFSLMGITLRPHLQGAPKWKVYLSLLILVDESWALALIQRRKEVLDANYMLAFLFGASLAFYLAFQIGTWAGFTLGYWIHNPKVLGIDFAFTAIFLSLLIGMWRGRGDIVPWFVAGGMALLSSVLIPGDWYIIIGALTGSLVGAWRAILYAMLAGIIIAALGHAIFYKLWHLCHNICLTLMRAY